MHNKERIKYIDVAKGIGIILVVWAHILMTGAFSKYLYSFFIPLFFLMSGFVFNIDKYNSLKQIVKTRFFNIITPYLWFWLLTYFYWLFVERRLSGNPSDPLTSFFNIFTSQGDEFMPYNPALWFLTCLFCVEIIFFLIIKTRKIIIIFLCLSACAVLGCLASLFLPGYLPWSIDVALTGVVFFGIGNIIESKNTFEWFERVLLRSNLILFPVIIISLSGGFAFSMLNSNIWMSQNQYGNIFLFYLSALFSIMGIMLISMKLAKSRFLNYIGRNSLIILCLHIPVKRAVQGLTSMIASISMHNLKSSFLYSSIDLIATIAILIPAIFIIQKYLPFLLGKMKKKTENIPENIPVSTL